MKSTIKKYDISTEYFFDEGCFITELSNTPNDPQLSIARARVAPGVTTKQHYLNATAERYIILEGLGRVEIGNLEPQIVTTGDIVIIAPEQHQRITNISETDLIFLAVCTPRFKKSNYFSVCID